MKWACNGAGTRSWRSNTLDRQRYALANANTHAGQSAAAIAGVELTQQRQCEPCTAHAQRVAQRDCTAIGIDVRGIVGQSERARAGQRLRGEGFVEFDRIELRDLQPQPLSLIHI